MDCLFIFVYLLEAVLRDFDGSVESEGKREIK